MAASEPLNVTIRLYSPLKEWFLEQAQQDRRTNANMAEVLIAKQYEQSTQREQAAEKATRKGK